MATEIRESPIVALRPFPHAGVGRGHSDAAMAPGRDDGWRIELAVAWPSVPSWYSPCLPQRPSIRGLIWDPIEDPIEEGRG
jgi:hypothetical protein